ncbi:MAG: hypothetical protein ACREHD_22540 [Pirellulales bacterium]
MKRLLFSAILLGGSLACALAVLLTARRAPSAPAGRPTVRSRLVHQGSAADFELPVRLKAGMTALRAESPGFAAPCWADLKGNGKSYLLVGQFHDGKIQVFKHVEAEKFAPGEWLQAEGNVAEVPGVW